MHTRARACTHMRVRVRASLLVKTCACALKFASKCERCVRSLLRATPRLRTPLPHLSAQLNIRKTLADDGLPPINIICQKVGPMATASTGSAFQSMHAETQSGAW
jgi:hypothetical protein